MSSDVIVASCLKFDNEQSRAGALEGVAEYLDFDGLVLAWQTLPTLTDEHAQAKVACALVNRLPASFAEQAVDLASTMRERTSRVSVLTAAFPVVTEQIRGRVFELILDTETGHGDPFTWAMVARLAPHLDSPQLDRIVEFLRSQSPIRCLFAIAKHLSPAHLDIALDEAARQDDNACALALSQLTPWLCPEQIDAAAMIAHNIGDRPGRARALGGLIAYLDGPARHDASRMITQTVITYPDSFVAHIGLDAGVAHMAPQHLASIIKTAGDDEHLHAERLAKAAPFMEPDDLIDALSVARTISSPWPKATALTGLVAHLPTAQRRTAIKELLDITKLPDHVRVESLAEVATHLDAAELDRVTAILESLQTDYALQLALDRMAQYLTPKQRETMRANIIQLTVDNNAEPQDHNDYEEVMQLIERVRAARS
ncbi:MAG TPA: hypothetical protein VFC19_00535 [Candidatus Limnocylindrales bacterium]|nr:hypothetical protein [Candidatus Limnocylindrales bacterium]